MLRKVRDDQAYAEEGGESESEEVGSLGGGKEIERKEGGRKRRGQHPSSFLNASFTAESCHPRPR